MKLTDATLDSMITAGLVSAFGGTQEEVTRVVTTLKDCDEAQVILRRNGVPVGVLIVADDALDAAQVRERAFAIRASLTA